MAHLGQHVPERWWDQQVGDHLHLIPAAAATPEVNGAVIGGQSIWHCRTSNIWQSVYGSVFGGVWERTRSVEHQIHSGEASPSRACLEPLARVLSFC